MGCGSSSISIPLAKSNSGVAKAKQLDPQHLSLRPQQQLNGIVPSPGFVIKSKQQGQVGITYETSKDSSTKSESGGNGQKVFINLYWHANIKKTYIYPFAMTTTDKNGNKCVLYNAFLTTMAFHNAKDATSRQNMCRTVICEVNDIFNVAIDLNYSTPNIVKGFVAADANSENALNFENGLVIPSEYLMYQSALSARLSSRTNSVSNGIELTDNNNNSVTNKENDNSNSNSRSVSINQVNSPILVESNKSQSQRITSTTSMKTTTTSTMIDESSNNLRTLSVKLDSLVKENDNNNHNHHHNNDSEHSTPSSPSTTTSVTMPTVPLVAPRDPNVAPQLMRCWAQKKGHFNPALKTRYFVLEKGNLSYYAEAKETAPYGKGLKGSIFLNQFNARTSSKYGEDCVCILEPLVDVTHSAKKDSPRFSRLISNAMSVTEPSTPVAVAHTAATTATDNEGNETDGTAAHVPNEPNSPPTTTATTTSNPSTPSHKVNNNSNNKDDDDRKELFIVFTDRVTLVRWLNSFRQHIEWANEHPEDKIINNSNKESKKLFFGLF